MRCRRKRCVNGRKFLNWYFVFCILCFVFCVFRCCLWILLLGFIWYSHTTFICCIILSFWSLIELFKRYTSFLSCTFILISFHFISYSLSCKSQQSKHYYKYQNLRKMTTNHFHGNFAHFISRILLNIENSIWQSTQLWFHARALLVEISEKQARFQETLELSNNVNSTF